jgi:hypothetical protein
MAYGLRVLKSQALATAARTEPHVQAAGVKDELPTDCNSRKERVQ